MNTIIINKEPVELFKILKFEGIVGSGGEAKMVISEGLVKVNGEVETQKRKKIVSGDSIEFMDEIYKVTLGDWSINQISKPNDLFEANLTVDTIDLLKS